MKNDSLLKEYNSILQEFIIDLCTKKHSNIFYYMPHISVIHDDKTTIKMPRVYDAFSKFGDFLSLFGISLLTVWIMELTWILMF